MDRPNYITPAGYAALRAEYERLFATERPALVDTIAWAAGNGDRRENGDYIYGRKRLREIDRRLGWLSKRMKAAKVVDPAAHADRTRIWFGATARIADVDDAHRVLTLVGDDETDATAGRIGWSAPIARALRGAAVGDVRRVVLPAGEREYEVIAIDYPPPPPGGTAMATRRSASEGEQSMASDPNLTRQADDPDAVDPAEPVDGATGVEDSATVQDTDAHADLQQVEDVVEEAPAPGPDAIDDGTGTRDPATDR